MAETEAAGPLDPSLFAPDPARDARFTVKDRWAECDNFAPDDPRRAVEFLHRQMNEEVNSIEACAKSLVDFPDPWWEKRHKKRRVFTEALVAEIQRSLEPGGQLRVASDVEEYFAVIRDLIAASPRFRELPVRYGNDTSQGRTRRALLIGGESVAPNTFVLGIDRDRDVMIVHQLVVNKGEAAD